MLLNHYGIAANGQFAINEEMIKALQNFKPGDLIPNYTDRPPEAGISQAEGDESLDLLGKERANADPTAQGILRDAHNRPPMVNNPNSAEMLVAEKLIDDAEAVLNEGCYKQPPECKTEWLNKTCEDYANYQHVYCGENLNIKVKANTDVLSRLIYSLGSEAIQSFDLVHGSIATRILANCAHLKASAMAYQAAQYPIEIIKQPTCADPTIEVRGIPQGQLILAITIQQQAIEESWSVNNCQQEQIKDCFLAESSVCIDANATKIIDGVSFTRPCWGHKAHYACLQGRQNNCGPLLEAGCSQTGSECIKTSFNTCEVFSQTFACPNKICLPEKIVCPGKIPCADGSCDQTVNEEADDFSEGLTRLGTLAATAAEVTKNQVKETETKIFAGEVKECSAWPIGLLDCCTGKGLLSAFINCPADLQALQKAREENRVVFLGDYKNHILGKRRFVHCVFPTILAGIIQLQGRNGQLHIPFGIAKNPDCRGLSPQELERLDFKALNLAPLEADFKARAKTTPDVVSIQAKNEEHILKLKEKEKPYD